MTINKDADMAHPAKGTDQVIGEAKKALCEHDLRLEEVESAIGS